MIETLPLLPSEFGQWDWTISNGIATAEQTIKAHEAITNQGKCSDFSRLVWNDLVDKIANAISDAGLTWDTTYGTADGCKINASMGALTASAFNAVAQNIYRFGFVNWKWAMIPSITGYVGRNQFNGYSTHKLNSDYVFGWYIVELALKLNRLLEVLKNTADFSEFNGGILMPTHLVANAEKIRICPATFEGASNTLLSTNLAQLPVLPFQSVPCARSDSDSILVLCQPHILSTDAWAESQIDAVGFRIKTMAAASKAKAESIGLGLIRNGPPTRFETDAFAKTNTDVFGDKIKTRAMFRKGFAKTIAETLLDSLGVSALGQNSRINSLPNVIMDASNIAFVYSTLITNSEVISRISPGEPSPFFVFEIGNSHESALMNQQESLLFFVDECATTSEQADLRALEQAALNAPTNARSILDGKMQRLCAVHMIQSINSTDNLIAQGGAMVSAPANGVVKGQGYHRAKGAAGKAAPFNFTDKTKSIIAVSAKSARAQHAEGTVFAPSNTICHGKSCVPAKSDGTKKAQSFSDAEAIKGIPGFAESAQKECTDSIGVVVSFPTKPFAALERAKSYCECIGTYPKSKAAASICKSASADYCEMDLEYVVHDGWKPAIQQGKNLYIRSVWLAQQEKSNVLIDVTTWYDPVYEDGNVHIISAHPQWQEGSTVRLDSGGVFYEPVQTGAEIYIRSIDSMKEVIKNG